MKHIWKVKDFVYLQAAQFISGLGDWLHVLAIFSLAAVTYDASPLALSLLVICQALPGVLFGPIAGVIADKYARKNVMISADILRALAVLGLFFTTALWQIYVLFFVIGFLSAVFAPAENGKLKEIVSSDQLPAAISMSEVLGTISKIAGPILGGILLTQLSVAEILLFDVVTFCVSAVLIGLIKTRSIHLEKPSKPEPLWTELTGGWNRIKSTPIVASALLTVTAALIVLQFADSQMMVLLRLAFDNPTSIFGYAIAASGVGMLIASLLAGAKKGRFSFAQRLLFGTIVIALAIIGTAYSVYLPLGAASIIIPLLLCLVGFGFTSIMIPFHVMVQRHTDTAHTGKVYGTINSFINLGALVGMGTGGFLTTFLGAVGAFTLTGVLLLAVGCTASLLGSRFWREENNAESIGETQGDATS